MTQLSLSDDKASLADKVQRVFGSLAIDKQRLPMSQLQKRGVPGYVAEWLLEMLAPGMGPLTLSEAEHVREWTAKWIPRPEDQNLIKSRLQRGDIVKVLTPVQVEVILKRHRQERVARMPLLGIDDAHISDAQVEQFPDLLRQGMWGIVELINTGDGVAIISFKPMQARVDLSLYKEARCAFDFDEWLDLMVLSMGYAPESFSPQQKILLVMRLLPLVQKSMHLVELAPKGTGKSYVYENISPHVRLLSGGNVSPAVLFVNNASGQWGLLARFAVVVLDEVQTLKFERPKEIVGGLKGFLANGRLTRGGMYETASDCGLVLLANIALDDRQQPVRYPYVGELPEFLQETAFLDRVKGLIPGWELPKLQSKHLACSVGLKSDFFGDVLLALRNDLGPDQLCKQRIHVEGAAAIRNENAVRDIASGMTKILFPHGEFTDRDFYRYCVKPAVRLRQLIWEQLYDLDPEYRQYGRELKAIVE
ncbi:MAG: BREX system Lon protease-like protein BrxL [candidate division WOR-3 bacterium]